MLIYTWVPLPPSIESQSYVSHVYGRDEMITDTFGGYTSFLNGKRGFFAQSNTTVSDS